MHELGGETDVVAHNRGEGSLIAMEVRLAAKFHLKACFGKQSVPERELLIHVQHARNAHNAAAFTWFFFLFPENKTFLFSVIIGVTVE